MRHYSRTGSLAKLSANNRRDLLELLEDRYATRSTLVTSHLPIENRLA